MIPTRQKLIGENKVEEYELFYEEGFQVYINDKITFNETYDQAVTRLERGE